MIATRKAWISAIGSMRAPTLAPILPISDRPPGNTAKKAVLPSMRASRASSVLKVEETSTESRAVHSISGSHATRPATTELVMPSPTVEPMMSWPARRAMVGAGRSMPAIPIAAAAISGPSTQASGK